MSLINLAVTAIGGVLICFIWWFFFGRKEETPIRSSSSGPEGMVSIIVDGGYKPSVIRVKKDSETTLKILRKDPNSCLEDIILPDFRISKYLPLNEEIEVKFTPHKSGEFGFHCGMNMYHGKIIVG